MLEINLKQLAAFVATAEYRSFTKAADAMYLTQSTVSAHISALERTLGLRLIQRSARQRVTLTEDGERVYRESKAILTQCQALQDMGKQNTENQLLLAATPVPSQCLLPEIMASFLSHYPDSRYVQYRGDSAQIHRFLEQGKCRLGFVGTAVNHQGFHYQTVTEDRLVVITPNRENYRKLKAQGATGNSLLRHPMLLREETSSTRQALDSCLNSMGMGPEQLNVIAQFDNSEDIRTGVSRGLGVSVISRLAVQEDVAAGKLLAFPLEGANPDRKIYLCWRKDTILTSLEHKFIRFLQDYQLKRSI